MPPLSLRDLVVLPSVPATPLREAALCASVLLDLTGDDVPDLQRHVARLQDEHTLLFLQVEELAEEGLALLQEQGRQQAQLQQLEQDAAHVQAAATPVPPPSTALLEVTHVCVDVYASPCRDKPSVLSGGTAASVSDPTGEDTSRLQLLLHQALSAQVVSRGRLILHTGHCSRSM